MQVSVPNGQVESEIDTLPDIELPLIVPVNAHGNPCVTASNATVSPEMVPSVTCPLL
jgi:hypothetical protein